MNDAVVNSVWIAHQVTSAVYLNHMALKDIHP